MNKYLFGIDLANCKYYDCSVCAVEIIGKVNSPYMLKNTKYIIYFQAIKHNYTETIQHCAHCRTNHIIINK